ncbi:T9SS type A sorting domain-containing protein [Bacteroides sp. OttesenSCG-928-J23]|nr:T9SS type A sorting domain-containing protein [Bacteroides sp. OttesenSCG-928-J23]
MKRNKLLTTAYPLISTHNFSQTFSGGTGTEIDPYLIPSKKDMEELAWCDGRHTSGKHYLLTQNITEEVTTTVSSFYGTFDGCGHSININVSTSGDAGVFGYAKGAIIKNLSVMGNIHSYATGDNFGAGGICGWAIKATIITNCCNTAGISTRSYYAGGICGHMVEDSKIINCLALNTAISSNLHTRRIANIDDSSTIENCYALDSMIVNGSSLSCQDANEENGKDFDNNCNHQLMNGKQKAAAATGIEKALMLNMSLYPNPVENELFIQSELPIRKIEIYTLTGICVLRSNHFNKKLNVSHLPNDCYYVRVYTDNDPITRKITIRK